MSDWFSNIPKEYGWILNKGQDCIISPDCDGMLCGLLMSHLLEWNIKGYYNGKMLAVEKNTNWEDCVFLDMEIYRNNVRSVGQHMLLVNHNKIPENWQNFNQCLSPNNLREFDSLHDFKSKYPLGTIHLLLVILDIDGKKIQLPQEAIQPLLYVDGVFKNLLNYPENCLDWLNEIMFEKTCLKEIFHNHKFSLYILMESMQKFFKELQTLSLPKNRADNLVIINRDNSSNIIDGTLCQHEKNKTESFLKLLSKKTDWKYNPNAWQWDNMETTVYKKSAPPDKPPSISTI